MKLHNPGGVRWLDTLYFSVYNVLSDLTMPFLPVQSEPTYVHRMLNLHLDACCTPDQAHKAATTPPPRRARLAELDANLHCSIIGTCLTTGELRKLVPRYATHLDRKSATDLDIHHTAVELSTAGEGAAKELHKALDARHELAIKRFRQAADDDELAALWSDALAHGDVPGAYWALLTHPRCSYELRRQAFGDVHMLSHLVGASNRADLRRLTALEEECVRLREQTTGQQIRLQDLGAQHRQAQATIDQQATELAQLRAQLASLCDDSTRAINDEAVQLRAALASTEEQLSLQIVRGAAAETQHEAASAAREAARRDAEQLRSDVQAARTEVLALEHTLAQWLEIEEASLPQLQGLCVLYVGGRVQSNQVLARLVAAAGGELLLHDGGLEDRKGMLATLLPRAHMVVFPVDFISHNAMHVTRQLAARAGIPCHPLRTASVASFVELMQREFSNQR